MLSFYLAQPTKWPLHMSSIKDALTVITSLAADLAAWSVSRNIRTHSRSVVVLVRSVHYCRRVGGAAI